MAKTKATTSDANTISKLVERVSPGSITIVKPTYSVREGLDAFAITVRHRGSPVTYVADSLEEAASDVLDYIDDPTEDPIVPHWTRLSRFQREVVVQTLREHGARHMVRAAEAKVSGSPAAHGAYEVADAFDAAVAALEHDDVDDRSVMLPREPLSAEKPSLRPIVPRTEPRTVQPPHTTQKG